MKTKNNIANKVSKIANEFNEEKLVRPFKELISWGNSKLATGIDGSKIAIFNIGTATDCAAHKVGLCKVRNICYALKAEQRWKQIIPYRNAQLEYWDTHTSSEFVKDLLVTINKEKRDIKALRFNEAGDLRTIDDLCKLVNIAQDLPFPVYTYTARKDLIDLARKIPHLVNGINILEEPNLILNGSGFMIHNEFKVVDTDFDLLLDKTHKVCNGDCSLCNLCMRKGGKIIQIIKH